MKQVSIEHVGRRVRVVTMVADLVQDGMCVCVKMLCCMLSLKYGSSIDFLNKMEHGRQLLY